MNFTTDTAVRVKCKTLVISMKNLYIIDELLYIFVSGFFGKVLKKKNAAKTGLSAYEILPSATGCHALSRLGPVALRHSLSAALLLSA